MKTIGYSRPLALCSVISVTRPSSSLRVSASATSATCCRKMSSVLLLRLAVASNSRADLDKLLEVLDAPLRLDRALGLERLDVARLREHRLQQVTDRDALGSPRARSSSIVSMKRRSALTAAVPRPGTRRAPPRPPTPRCRASRRGDHARERCLADAAPRRVGDAREAHHVEGVGEQRQVGDRVLDLGALVELGAADHLVGDLAAHERVLQHPRHARWCGRRPRSPSARRPRRPAARSRRRRSAPRRARRPARGS